MSQREAWNESVRAARRARHAAARGWPDTPKAVLARAAASERAALSALCRLYWHPVFLFLRNLGAGHDDAQDVTQRLLAELVQREQFRRVDPTRRFRTWLRQCAKNYLFRAKSFEKAKKRHLDDVARAELVGRLEGGRTDSVETLLDRREAFEVLDRAWGTLRRTYVAGGKGALFEHLDKRLRQEDEPRSDAEAARALKLTQDHLRVIRWRFLNKQLPRAYARELAANHPQVVT
jgi:RNA polymerase sigma-70 factor (ECF subfamily)